MPFKVIEDTEAEREKGVKPEKAKRVYHKAKAEIKDLEPGQGVVGVIGTWREDLPDEPEALMPEEEIEKKAYIDFLAKTIIPNKLSDHSAPESDRRSFLRKLQLSSLARLKQFIPKEVNVLKVTPEDLPMEIKMEIDRRYHDLSP